MIAPSRAVLALLLHVGDEAYAVACADVISVVPRPLLRRVPGVSREVSGVFVFRGGVVPVVDLALRFGADATPDLLSSRVVLVKPHDRVLGLLAAHVGDVVRLARDVGHAPMPTEPSVDGVVLLEGRTVLWLALSGLLPAEMDTLLTGAP